MSCELNEDVACEDCTRDYCPDMIKEALKEWYEIHSEIQHYQHKLDKLEFRKQKWLKFHKVLLS